MAKKHYLIFDFRSEQRARDRRRHSTDRARRWTSPTGSTTGP